MMVVPYRPGQRFLFTLLVLIGVAVSAAGGWGYAYYSTVLTQQGEQADTQVMSAQITELRQENEALKRQAAILDRLSAVDQQTGAELQETLTALRQRVAQLEEDVLFYRQVVEEETKETGLVIGQLDIDATRSPGRYRYKLVMRQLDADGDTYLNGHVNFNLVGQMLDQQVVLPLRDLSEVEDELDIRLRFKYFQNIEGELALPEGFEPDRIQIAAVATEPVSKRIDEDFGWVVALE
jgi:cell division protein FtsB